MLWSKDVLEVNPACQVAVHHVGPGKQKVPLADRFFKYPGHVSELALNLYYHETQALVGGYPGSRAVITLDTGPLMTTMSKLWGEPLAPFHSDYHPVIFSAILNRDYELTPWQRQPHIDQGVTAMIYLNPEDLCSGGGLFRHRPTGLDWLPLAVNADIIELDRARQTARSKSLRPATGGRIRGIHEYRDLQPPICSKGERVYQRWERIWAASVPDRDASEPAGDF